MRIFNIRIILLLLASPFVCSNPAFYQSEVPQPPVNLRVVANPGKTFTLYYYVQNTEDNFDGYNLYISREPDTSGNVNVIRSANPVYTKDGSYPTLIHDKSQYDSDNVKTYIVDTYLSYISNNLNQPITTYLPFEAGVRYFFKISSHTFFNIESTNYSNEVSAKAIP